MDIEKLKAFYYVAKTKSFTKASKAIFLTQPAVSKKIQLLEQELGTTLFERIGNKVYTTEAGKILLPYAEKIIETIEDAKESILKLRNPLFGRLEFGASSIPAIHFLPYFLNKFSSLYPYIKVSLKLAYGKEILSKIIDNQIDFGIVEETGKEKENNHIKIESLIEDYMVIITPNNKFYNDKFKNKDSLCLDDIKTDNIIFTEEGSSLRKYLDSSIIDKQISFESYLEFGNVESTKKLVKYGFGIAIVPFLSILNEVKTNNIKFYKIKGIKFSRKILLIYLKDKQLSNSTKLFINYIKNNLKEFIKSEGNSEFLNLI